MVKIRLDKTDWKWSKVAHLKMIIPTALLQLVPQLLVLQLQPVRQRLQEGEINWWIKLRKNQPWGLCFSSLPAPAASQARALAPCGKTYFNHECSYEPQRQYCLHLLPSWNSSSSSLAASAAFFHSPAFPRQYLSFSWGHCEQNGVFYILGVEKLVLTLPPQHHLRKTVFHRQKPWSLPQVPGSKPKRKWSCLAPDGNTKMDSEPLMATLGTSLSENMLPSPLFYQVSGIELKDECLVFKWLYPV